MSINRSLHRIAKEGVVQTLEEKDKEIERLQNIIKEVREWVEKNKCKFTRDDEIVVSEVSFVVNAKPSELLEILDKGE